MNRRLSRIFFSAGGRRLIRRLTGLPGGLIIVARKQASLSPIIWLNAKVGKCRWTGRQWQLTNLRAYGGYIVKKSPVFRLWKSGNPIALRRLSYRLLLFYVYSPGVTVISRLGPIRCETGESRLVAFVLSFSPWKKTWIKCILPTLRFLFAFCLYSRLLYFCFYKNLNTSEILRKYSIIRFQKEQHP